MHGKADVNCVVKIGRLNNYTRRDKLGPQVKVAQSFHIRLCVSSQRLLLLEIQQNLMINIQS